MSYKIGDTVVYPRHGAAKVVGVEDKTTPDGKTRTYLKLDVLSTDGLIIFVPADSVESIGVRDIAGGKDVDKVFDILRKPLEEEKTNWSRRYKMNQERIASGELPQIAHVVRDLTQRNDDEHGLSAGEKRMLTKARKILSAEISLSEHVDEDEMQRLLDVNLGLADPQPGDEEHHTRAPEEPATETLRRIEEQGSKSRRRAARRDEDDFD